MAYNDKKIKLDASEKDINEKFKNEIENIEEKIYWYIKFSLPLEEESVSKKTMKVTDTKGYIFKTDIIYNKALELIVIETLEPYKEEEYYILQISKDVKAENLKTLKKDVNILFKIKGGVVEEYKVLGDNVVVPKPKKKLKSKKNRTRSKVYSFQKEDNQMALGGDRLSYIRIKFNPLLAIVGVPLFLIGIFLTSNAIIALGGVVSCLGFFHILSQVLNRNFRSNLYYNLGVVSFNKEKYKKAQKRFKKSITINSYNEYSEYALNKVSFFL
ncbi:hypothetical protein [uncultured Tyzzerella sp.]|uniref:hypothetical protein n=1 Tax=uncultured Tyzzerella sp. TaxID=2321398 RepID=UPI0029426F60|nr:hypothetical protein [uncultured Tyzzerella sp.]